jgi:hypothetical protein
MSVSFAQVFDPGGDGTPPPMRPPHPENIDPVNPAAPVAAAIFNISLRVIFLVGMKTQHPSGCLDAKWLCRSQVDNWH